MRSYLPPAAELLKVLRISRDRLDAPGRVVVDTRVMKALIEMAAMSLPFDEAVYRSNYADLDEAVRAGRIESLRDHYISHGYLENREAFDFPVDEDWYLSVNPDVSDGIKAGEFRSGSDHYKKFGRQEGRSPSPEVDRKIAIWREMSAGV